MINATITKFGYPTTLVRDYEHWVLLVRPAQPTLGSLVLASKSDATAYGQLPSEAFAEQGSIVKEIEAGLRNVCDYERINYLMLMMVDREVHFHVIPRYADSRRWDEQEFRDAGWPGPPDLKSAIVLPDASLERLGGAIRSAMP